MIEPRILIAEISGKRPGTSKQRPTERFDSEHDWVIISNNSEGYETDKPIINVPDDYREWYCANIKNSDNAWYAPMNRSYAIKWARENGYDYLVQLDDNIKALEIAYTATEGAVTKRYRIRKTDSMLDGYISVFIEVLKNTNAVMVGGQLAGIGTPDACLLAERFVYSFFALDLKNCPDVFHGDFEDDIEYRLKCRQMGLPVLQVQPLRYSKVGQQKTKDMSGCRAEYLKAGLKRGEHMTQLYSDVYSCRMTRMGHHVRSLQDEDAVNFKHTIKPFKIGVVVYDMEPIKLTFLEILARYAENKPDKSIFKVKKRKINKG